MYNTLQRLIEIKSKDEWVPIRCVSNMIISFQTDCEDAFCDNFLAKGPRPDIVDSRATPPEDISIEEFSESITYQTYFLLSELKLMLSETRQQAIDSLNRHCLEKQIRGFSGYNTPEDGSDDFDMEPVSILSRLEGITSEVARIESYVWLIDICVPDDSYVRILYRLSE